jgi:hypothetical protein
VLGWSLSGWREEQGARRAEVVLVLDSGGVSRLAERSRQAAALILAFQEIDLWPPRVPSVVLVECLQGHAGRDALTNRFLKTCDVVEVVPEGLARRAALLRRKAHRGSAVDAIVTALAEPGGTVVTSDPENLDALARHSDGVAVERV